MNETGLIPNSTQIPNILLDFLMPLMRESERAVLIYICRRTYGFHRERDAISVQQFVEGLKRRDGSRLDLGCGVSRPKVVESLAFLEAAGLVEKRGGGRGRGHIQVYRLLMDGEIVKKINLSQQMENINEIIVNFLNPFRKGKESLPFKPIKGKDSLQEKVNFLNLQNKEKQSKEKLRGPNATSSPPERFQPSENLRAWHTREFPQYDLSDAIDACLDYYRTHGKTAMDYEAAIRNWFRRGHKYGTLKLTTTRQSRFVE